MNRTNAQDGINAAISDTLAVNTKVILDTLKEFQRISEESISSAFATFGDKNEVLTTLVKDLVAVVAKLVIDVNTLGVNVSDMRNNKNK